MAIFKKKHYDQFVMVPAQILRDPNLSMKERGLLCTFYSLREDWHFSLEGMERILADGISSIRNAYQNLIRKGYVKEHRNRSDDGKFGGKDLFLKIPNETANAPPDGFPPVDNPPVVSPSEENPMTEKRRQSIKQKDNNKGFKMKDKKPQTRERSGTNRFNNFPQREYDYDKLESCWRLSTVNLISRKGVVLNENCSGKSPDPPEDDVDDQGGSGVQQHRDQ